MNQCATLAGILGVPGSLQHEIGKIDLRPRVAGEGRHTQPARRLLRVRRDALTGQIQRPQGMGRGLVTGLGGPAVPARRLGVVRGQFAVPDIEIADQHGGFRIAGQRRPAQPGLADREDPA